MAVKSVLLFLFITLACGCTSSINRDVTPENRKLQTGIYRLPSGDQINITNISKMDFPESGPALVMYYKTQIAIEDKPTLRKQVDEIWSLFRVDAETEGVRAAAIRAVHDLNTGSIRDGKGYGFVFLKNTDGTWHCTDDEKQ